MLKRVKLANFKSFNNEQVDVAAFTLLVGVNASGKSNLLDAVRFLQGLSQGYSLSEILSGRYEGGTLIWRGVRGATNEIALDPTKPVSIETTWTARGGEYTHKVEFIVDEEPRLTAEQLLWDDANTYLFDTHAPSLGAQAGPTYGGGINVAFKRAPGGSGGRSPSHIFPADRAVISRRLPLKNVHTRVVEVSEAVTAQMAGALFLDLQPNLMRDFRSSRIKTLGVNGENLSAALYNLCKDEERKIAIVDWLSEVCAPEISDIDFVETEFDQVLLVLVEGSGKRVSAKSVSDGTLRFLGQLTALLTAEAGTLLLIEELENGLHPSRQHLLVDAIRSHVEHMEAQVMASTHSPTLLETLPDDVLENAIIFGRKPPSMTTVMRNFRKLEYFETFRDSKRAGDLFTSLWLERAL